MLISIRVTQVCFGANTKMLKTKRTPFLLWSRAVAASSVEKWGVKQGGWKKWKGNGKGYNNFICKLQRLSSRRNLVWGFKSRNICARGGGGILFERLCERHCRRVFPIFWFHDLWQRWNINEHPSVCNFSNISPADHYCLHEGIIFNKALIHMRFGHKVVGEHLCDWGLYFLFI